MITITDSYGSSAYPSFGGAISNFQFADDLSSGTLVIYNSSFIENAAFVTESERWRVTK